MRMNLFSYYWLYFYLWLTFSLFSFSIHVVPSSNLTQDTNHNLRLFDWIVYFELYHAQITHDLDLQPTDSNNNLNYTKAIAWRHYSFYGQKKGLSFPLINPNEPSNTLALKKLHGYLGHSSLTPRTMIIYHIGPYNAHGSKDVILNNLIYFTRAILLDHFDLNNPHFYWFNIIGGTSNPFYELVVSRVGSLPNVVIVDWEATSSDMIIHFRLLEMLQSILETSFSYILCLNEGVRGPFALREQGQWITPFIDLLNLENVGLTGITINKRPSIHIQSHFFGFSTQRIPLILSKYNSTYSIPMLTRKSLINHYEVGLSEWIQSHGWNISSLFYQTKGIGKIPGIFNGTIYEETKIYSTVDISSNPASWCHINPKEILFVKWGGDILRNTYAICETLRDTMRQLTSHWRISNPYYPQEDSYHIPEIIFTNEFNFTEQYEYMIYDAYDKYQINNLHNPQINQPITQPQVCFFLHTTNQHLLVNQNDILYSNHDDLAYYQLQSSIEGFLGQQNSHWKAFYYYLDVNDFDYLNITNPQTSFEDEINQENNNYGGDIEYDDDLIHNNLSDKQEWIFLDNFYQYSLDNIDDHHHKQQLAIKDILSQYNDSRFQLFEYNLTNINISHFHTLTRKKKYSVLLSHWKQALQTFLLTSSSSSPHECAWVMMGQADSFYGTDIVQDILEPTPSTPTTTSPTTSSTTSTTSSPISSTTSNNSHQIILFPYNTKTCFYDAWTYFYPTSQTNYIDMIEMSKQQILQKQFGFSCIQDIYGTQLQSDLLFSDKLQTSFYEVFYRHHSFYWPGIALTTTFFLREIEHIILMIFANNRNLSTKLQQPQQPSLEQQFAYRYFTNQSMVQIKHIHSLASLVYDYTSPLRCIASGRIWLNHRDKQNKAVCLTILQANHLIGLERRETITPFKWLQIPNENQYFIHQENDDEFFQYLQMNLD